MAVLLANFSLGARLAGAQQRTRTIQLFDGVAFPTGIAFDSKGTMYFNERPGRVRVARGRNLLPRPLAKVPTSTVGETGLLGITVSPDDSFVYVFATVEDGSSNEVLRVPARGGRLETIVEGLPASVYHNGGGVVFASDGTLLVSNGERHESERSQQPDVLGGKVYRFSAEGSIPPDNPFGDSPTFALGLRNPYGIAVDPVSRDAFVTENGPSSFDEVNRITRGGNYGWPLVTGPSDDVSASDVVGTYHDPVLSFEQIVVPTGIAFADESDRLGDVSGDLFFATYGEQSIHRVELDAAREHAVSDEIIVRSPEPVIALAWGPRGLYYSTPTQVRLVPFATSGGENDQHDRQSRDRGAAGKPRSERREQSDEPSTAGTIIQVLVGVLLLGGLAWSLSRGRRPAAGPPGRPRP